MNYLPVQTCRIERVMNGYLITAAAGSEPETAAVAKSANDAASVVRKLLTEGVPEDPDFAEVDEAPIETEELEPL